MFAIIRKWFFDAKQTAMGLILMFVPLSLATKNGMWSPAIVVAGVVVGLFVILKEYKDRTQV